MDELTKLTIRTVTAMLQTNRVDTRDVPRMITNVHETLVQLSRPAEAPEEPQPSSPPEGAVTVRKSLSLMPDKIISMIDGKPYSALKRHLSTHGLTPAEYRERYGLKPDYPMSSPASTAMRREIALARGLGRKPKAVAEPEPEPELPEITPEPTPEPVADKPKRTRKLKAKFAEPEPAPAEEEPFIEERIVLPDPDAEFFPDD